MNTTVKSTLAESADIEILKIAGVKNSGRGSYRVGDKVFVRLGTQSEKLAFGFKLTHSDAKLACDKHAYVTPMNFGNMGNKGWVDFELTRKPQLKVLLRLLEVSRALYK